MANDILVALIVALAAAAAGGFLAILVRQPAIVGFLVAGIVIGPFGFQFVQNVDIVNGLAQLGLVFLLFATGVGFRVGDIRIMGPWVVVASLAHLALVIGVIGGALLLFDIPLGQALFAGLIVSAGSTIAAIKNITDRGEGDTFYGRVVTTVSLVQDTTVILLLIVVQAVVTAEGNLVLDVATTLLLAALVVGVMVLVGGRAAPWALRLIGQRRSRELIIVAVAALALGTALATAQLGLGLILGAFAAGLALSESEYTQQVIGQIEPLKDTFASLFFVSLGMLTDIGFVVVNLPLVAGAAVVVILLRVVLCWLPLLLARFRGRVPVFAALALMPIGELSFILVSEGSESGLVQPFVGSTILAVAVLSIIVSPWVFAMGPGITRLLARIRITSGDEAAAPIEIRNHVVVGGYGNMGRLVTRSLLRRGFRTVVVEEDPRRCDRARQDGAIAVLGDMSLPAVIQGASVATARCVALVFSDPRALEGSITAIRTANPRAEIVVRGLQRVAPTRFRDLGAREVVVPEFEGGLEALRFALTRFGVESREIQLLLNQLREDQQEAL